MDSRGKRSCLGEGKGKQGEGRGLKKEGTRGQEGHGKGKRWKQAVHQR